MNIRKLLERKMFYLLPIVLLLSGYSRIDAQPKSGDWTITTDFGEFVFTVDTTGTHVIKLSTTFSSYMCGGVTQNGTITSSTSPGWVISDSEFSIEKSVNPSGTIKMTINGTFNQLGDEASGTWSINVSGTICTGTWSSILVAVEENVAGLSERFGIAQNYPNPFNYTTTIRFALPKTMNVSIKVYNAMGIEVETLIDKYLMSGHYKTIWNAADFPSGMYLYQMKAGNFVETKKLWLVK